LPAAYYINETDGVSKNNIEVTWSKLFPPSNGYPYYQAVDGLITKIEANITTPCSGGVDPRIVVYVYEPYGIGTEVMILDVSATGYRCVTPYTTVGAVGGDFLYPLGNTYRRTLQILTLDSRISNLSGYEGTIKFYATKA
jgi:hypothetical protein